MSCCTNARVFIFLCVPFLWNAKKKQTKRMYNFSKIVINCTFNSTDDCHCETQRVRKTKYRTKSETIILTNYISQSKNDYVMYVRLIHKYKEREHIVYRHNYIYCLATIFFFVMKFNSLSNHMCFQLEYMEDTSIL